MKHFQAEWHEAGHYMTSRCLAPRQDLSGDSGVILWGSGHGHAQRERQARVTLRHIQMFGDEHPSLFSLRTQVFLKSLPLPGAASSVMQEASQEQELLNSGSSLRNSFWRELDWESETSKLHFQTPEDSWVPSVRGFGRYN